MAEEFTHRVAVRYLEVDGQGVVFNMWYLAYADDALTAFLEHHGLPYERLMASGFDVQLVHAELDWRGGVRWREDLRVAVAVARVGTTSFDLRFRFLVGDREPAAATIVYVCVATDGSGKRPLPPLLRAGLGLVADG